MPAASPLELDVPHVELVPRAALQAVASGPTRPALTSGPHPLARAGHEPGLLGIARDAVDALVIPMTIRLLRWVLTRR